MHTQETYGNMAMEKDDEEDEEYDAEDDLINICRVGDKEWPFLSLFYEFVIFMSYLPELVWMWISINIENIMRVLSTRYHKTNTSTIIRTPK